MSSRLKAIIQYVVILCITAFLIWLSLRGLTVKEGTDKWAYLVETWSLADKKWLLLMAVVSVLSHMVRAVRWKMLLVPTGNSVKASHSFFSLMVVYLVNLVIPRGGEVSRCYNLFKLSKVPVDVSFGTVVIERIVDMICLALLILLAFILEWNKLLAFLETLSFDTPERPSQVRMILYLAVGGFLVLALLFWMVQRKASWRSFFLRIWKGFRKGLLSVFQLRQKGLFLFYSLLIWVLYFFMSYSVIMAFPATANLGFNAVISLFGIGSIAMAAPLPGGTGSYHVLVPQGLVFLYDLPLQEAVALTFIFHGWQTLIMIMGGAFSLVATSILVKR